MPLSLKKKHKAEANEGKCEKSRERCLTGLYMKDIIFRETEAWSKERNWGALKGRKEEMRKHSRPRSRADGTQMYMVSLPGHITYLDSCSWRNKWLNQPRNKTLREQTGQQNKRENGVEEPARKGIDMNKLDIPERPCSELKPGGGWD